MARRVFLHVGLPKSGTTYLQAVVGKNKSELRERAGLLYPGATWARQVDAVRDVRRMKLPPAQQKTVPGAWDRLVAEMRAWPSDALMSMEWLCMATAAQVVRIADDLADTETHVVFTVRDVGRTVPAAWQEFAQNRSTWRWPEFLEQVSSEQAMETEAGLAFWQQQDMELLLERWSALAPPERLHVITLPQSGADPAELWRRMAAVLGIDAEGYDLSDLGSNASLGMESAELMRRINERLRGRGIGMPAYNNLFKHRLAKQVLAARKAEESKVVLPAEYHDWARARADQQIRAIQASGAQVVGDLEDLRPRLDAAKAPARAVEPDPAAVLDAAVEALIPFVLDSRRRRGAPRRLAPAPAVPAAEPTTPGGPIARARHAVAERVRGRSAKELLLAAGRRVRPTTGAR
ncbi:hypothetical protein [Nocardioides pakistanensis]